MRSALVTILLLASTQAFAEEWVPFAPPVAQADRVSQADLDSVKYPEDKVVDFWVRDRASADADVPESYVIRHAVVNCNSRKVYYSTISQYKNGALDQHLDVAPAIVYAPGLAAGDYFLYCKKFYQIWK